MTRWPNFRRLEAASGSGRLPALSVAVLVVVIALQGTFIGHQLSHDGPTLDECAICHVTGTAAALDDATPELIAADLSYRASWVPHPRIGSNSALPSYRAGRAPPLLRL